MLTYCCTDIFFKGDSRAVLCRAGKPVQLSDDHKPEIPAEAKAIRFEANIVVKRANGFL